nr:MAG TPA: hypothetical protein [Bacteriophage sp.]
MISYCGINFRSFTGSNNVLTSCAVLCNLLFIIVEKGDFLNKRTDYIGF